MGSRAFTWTEEAEDDIFRRLAEGEGIIQICGVDRDGWLPSQVTFYKRVTEDAEFAKRYARAREAQAHNEFEEIRMIADNATPEGVQVARLQIDARKWRAAKLAPTKYGDKIDVVSSDGSMSPKPVIDASKLSDEAMAEILNASFDDD